MPVVRQSVPEKEITLSVQCLSGQVFRVGPQHVKRHTAAYEGYLREILDGSQLRAASQMSTRAYLEAAGAQRTVPYTECNQPRGNRVVHTTSMHAKRRQRT